MARNSHGRCDFFPAWLSRFRHAAPKERAVAVRSRRQVPSLMGCAQGVAPSNPVVPDMKDNSAKDPISAVNVPPESTTSVHSNVAPSMSSHTERRTFSSDGQPIVMGKYKMSTSKQDLMGEGTSSICRKGVCLETGQEVAIKVYKAPKDPNKGEDVRLQKFRRQISVLNMLQEPFGPVKDERLWHPQLASTKPSKLFMTLLDYSRDDSGTPAPDPQDGVMYVVTELAQYSLKDYLSLRRDQDKGLSRGAVKNISKAIILVVAGLHAKGLVHLDLKPENLMMFNGRLKLIDVDGCVPAGSEISIQDSSISFSPCYCAPEWARFLIEESESKITVNPHLDVWSVGMTVCELATLDAVLKPMYANFLRNGHSHKEAGFLFMDWLGSISKAPLPKSIERFDDGFHKMLVGSLLVCDHTHRKTLAQCLSDPYLESDSQRASTVDQTTSVQASTLKRSWSSKGFGTSPSHERATLTASALASSAAAWGAIATSAGVGAAGHGGTAGAGSYKSVQVLSVFVAEFFAKAFGVAPGHQAEGIDRRTRKRILFLTLGRECQEPASIIAYVVQDASVGLSWFWQWRSRFRFTFNTTRKRWTRREAPPLPVNEKVDRTTRNRIEDTSSKAPQFKGTLWKLNNDGNAQEPAHWLKRDMWVAFNGSLCYFSIKENKRQIGTQNLVAIPQKERMRWTVYTDKYPFCQDRDTCWACLGRIHSILPPMPGRLRDYISSPKARENLYMCLHTTVLLDGTAVEVYILSAEMDWVAEFGVGAYWRHNEDSHELQHTDTGRSLLSALHSTWILQANQSLTHSLQTLEVMDPSPLSRPANRTLASKSSSRSISSPPSEPNQLPLQLPLQPLLPTELLAESPHLAQSDHSSDVVTIGVEGDSEKDEILELMDVADLADVTDVADVERDGDEVPMTVDDALALDDFSPDLEWIQPGPTPTTAGTPTSSTTSSLDLDRVSVAEQSELMDGGKRTV
eukprot:s396_g22.t1